jgi:hypothetical protein
MQRLLFPAALFMIGTMSAIGLDLFNRWEVGHQFSFQTVVNGFQLFLWPFSILLMDMQFLRPNAFEASLWLLNGLLYSAVGLGLRRLARA